MLCLLVTTVLALNFRHGTTTPLDFFDERRLPSALLCGNYSMDINETMFIKSENYKNKYPKNHECDYTFHCTDYASSILLDCEDDSFKLQQSKNCAKDFVRVYDNNVINEKYCGLNPPKNVVTGKNFLGVYFKTNGDNKRGFGFFCSVRCYHIDDKTTSSTTSTTTTTTSTTTQTTTTTTVIPRIVPETYSKCECGVAKRSSVSRIAGGSVTEIGEYPWQVAITANRLRSPICGGTLLNDRYVITAAHCVVNEPEFDLLFGEHNYLMVSKVLIRKPANISVHPAYNAGTKDNDIAIVKLSSPINLNTNMAVKPICLPDQATDFSGMKAIATGWGATSNTGSLSPNLLEVEVTIENDSSSSDVLSAQEPQGGKDTCSGDNGGPLIVEVNGTYVLAGVTKFRTECAIPGNPSYYTKVQSNLDWIKTEISDGINCGTNFSNTSAQSTSSTTSTTSTTTMPPPTLNPGLQCICGIPPNPLRTAASSKINNHPWTVALSLKSTGNHYCSGTVINTYFILTASSCVRTRTDMEVNANAQNVYTSETRVINRDVNSIVTNSTLSLLKLAVPLSLTNWDGIKPACLAANQLFIGSNAVHSGYGGLTSQNSQNGIVRKTEGIVMGCSSSGDDVECFQPIQTEGFCGAGIGGPIVATGNNGRQYLVGIATNDNGCSMDGGGALYQEMAKVAYYFPWIWSKSQDGRFCTL